MPRLPRTKVDNQARGLLIRRLLLLTVLGTLSFAGVALSALTVGINQRIALVQKERMGVSGHVALARQFGRLMTHVTSAGHESRTRGGGPRRADYVAATAQFLTTQRHLIDTLNALHGPEPRALDARALDALSEEARVSILTFWRTTVDRLDRPLQPRLERFMAQRRQTLLLAVGLGLLFGPVMWLTIRRLVDFVTQSVATQHQTEERLIAIVNSAADAILSLSPTGIVQTWNPGAQRMLGYTAEEIVGKPVALIVPPDRRDEPQKCMASLRRGDRVVALESVRVRKDGTLIDASHIISPLKDASGALIGASCILRDITEYKRIERALRSSEETARAQLREIEQIYKYSPVGMFVFDRDYRFLRINDRMAEINGTPVEHHIGRTIDEIVPDLAAFLKDAFRPIFERGEPVLNLEIHGATPRDPGLPRDWIGNYFPLKSDAGEAAGLIGVVLDVTERRQAERALRQSHDLLASLAAHAPGALYQFRLFPDGRSCLPYASTGFTNMFEVPPDTLLDDAAPIFARTHPDDHAGLLASIQVSARDLSQWNHEYRVVLPERGIRWLQAQSFPEKLDDGSILWHGFVTDLTERKGMECALKESEQRFAKLFHAAPVVMCLTDAETGVLIDVNQEGLALFGLPRAEMIGRTTLELPFCGDNPEARTDVINHIVTHGGFRNHERAVPHPDGRVLELSGSSELVSLSGRPCVLSAFLDISQRKRVEEEARAVAASLRTLSARIEAAREQERVHIAREIHDTLAQDLTRVSFDLSWIARRLPQSAGESVRRELLEKVDAMIELINRTMRTGQNLATALRPVVLDRMGLPAAIAWQAEEFQTRTNIECRVEVPQALPALPSDQATGLFRIFQESLTNVARHAKASRVDVSLREQQGQVTLRIRDNGRGVSKKEVTDPLSIGLLGMHERATACGGRLAIAGRPGWGTIVRVRMPLTVQAAESDPS